MRGPSKTFVLIFIHLGNRRNTLMWCANEGIAPGFLIRDADTKFSASFDAVWESEAARVIRIPHRAPDANAFAESFITTIKRECLDFFLSFSRAQLDDILRTWGAITTPSARIVGGTSGTALQIDFRPARDGPFRRRHLLGGIITSCTRDAA